MTDERPTPAEDPTPDQRPVPDEWPESNQRPAPGQRPESNRRPTPGQGPESDQQPASDQGPEFDQRPELDQRPESGRWPIAELDPVRRLRVLAAAIPGATVASRVLAAPFDRVWAAISDLEGELGTFQPDLHRLTIIRTTDIRATDPRAAGIRAADTRTDGTRLEAVARSRFGMRARFDVVLEPGYCWMQSRFLLVGMAARPDPAGTLVAMTGGLRIPGRSALIPVLVGSANRHAIDRLARRLNA